MALISILSISIVVFINLAGLIWCYTQQSDKVTDLFYSLSFFAIAAIGWVLNADSWAHHLIFGMVGLWSIRLGLYLSKRIHKMGKDDRFNQMRKRFVAIAGFWFLQTISILILAIPVIIIFQKSDIPFHILHLVGFLLWLLGFTIESLADQQKFSFRNNPKNSGQFVNIGLWRKLQHPNYLGEILCWIGVFVLVSPSLSGLEWLSIISPIWISVLLLFISGIPLLQKAAKKKYGHLKSFQEYQKNTALIVPFLY